MLNISNINSEFLKYVDNFDLNDEKIERKKYHSMRVKEISKEIAEDLKLSKEYVNLAMVIGLLHDIGRFEQEKQYNTFIDARSFDHGDYGANLLEKNIHNYIDDNRYNNIIIQAVKNHNKPQIDSSLKGDELLFSKIVRDADKLDIMYESINMFYVGKEELISTLTVSDYSYNFIKEGKLIVNLDDIKFNNLDRIIRTIAFIFDLNFRKSFEIVKENNYISKIIRKFDYKNKETKIRMNEIEGIANEFIDKKIKKDLFDSLSENS